MTSIQIPFKLLKNWFEKDPRYFAIRKSENFQSEVNAAYIELEKKAAGKVEIRTKHQFAEYAERYMIVQFAKVAAEAYFSDKSLEKEEEKTIFNPAWISEQVRLARRIIDFSIQVEIYKKNRVMRMQETNACFEDEGEEYWDD